jgi:hypothetical protein
LETLEPAAAAAVVVVAAAALVEVAAGRNATGASNQRFLAPE